MTTSGEGRTSCAPRAAIEHSRWRLALGAGVYSPRIALACHPPGDDWLCPTPKLCIGAQRCRPGLRWSRCQPFPRPRYPVSHWTARAMAERSPELPARPLLSTVARAGPILWGRFLIVP